jgi:hypothetical protein
MHFGSVKVADLYSVSPEATLGPTVQEVRDYERKKRLREFGVSKDDERNQ